MESQLNRATTPEIGDGGSRPARSKLEMDFSLEIVLVLTALAVALGAAQRGKPGPSYLIAAVAALNAISFLIRPNPHGDMLLAWGVAVLAAGIGLFGRRVHQRNQ